MPKSIATGRSQRDRAEGSRVFSTPQRPYDFRGPLGTEERAGKGQKGKRRDHPHHQFLDRLLELFI